MAFTNGQTTEFTKAGGSMANNMVWEFIKMETEAKQNTDFGRMVSESDGLRRMKKIK